MSIKLNDNILTLAPKATDERYGPYPDVSSALLTIEPIVRYKGLTIGVLVGGEIVEYWFKEGISNTDLIIKTPSSAVDDIGFACSDETTVLTTGLVFTMRMPYSVYITGVRLSLNTASIGSNLTADIKLDGATIFTVKPNIIAGEEFGGLNAVLNSSYLPAESELTVFIDQVGTSATGLKVWLIGVNKENEIAPALQDANKVYAGPASGPPAISTFRFLQAADLPNTAVMPGEYGSASQSATFTVDSAGRLTSASEADIAITTGQVSGLAAVATSGSYGDLTNRPDPVFIQATAPTTTQLAGSTRYSWWQVIGDDLTLWIETGV